MRDCDPYDKLALRGTSFSHNSPTNLFIVPRLLSTTWSTETVLPTDNQVVTPLVLGFDFPTSSGCGHPSNTLVSGSASHFSLCGMLPCSVRCSYSHDNRVATLSNVVVGLARLDPIMLSFSWLACMTSVSCLLISLSNVTLLFLSHAHSSSSSRSFMLPHRMFSCNCLTPLPRSSHPVPTAGAVVWGFFFVLLVASLLDIVEVISTLRFFLMVL